MKRKIYQQLLDWKEKRNGEVALLVEGARRIGKSYIVEEFGKNEYESYILIDFNRAPQIVRDWFDLYLEDLDMLFLYLSQHYKVRLHERKSLIILDEVQLCPRARAAIKFLVKDGRYDYIETGSLVSIKKNTQGIVLPSEERPIQMFPMDFEEFLWACNISEDVISMLKDCYEQLRPIPDFLHKQIMERYRQYLIVGGMPEVVMTYLENEDFTKTINNQKDILSGYRNDISKYAGNEKVLVKSVFDAIPGQLSKQDKRFVLASIEKNASRRKYGAPTQWLVDAGMAYYSFNVGSFELPFPIHENIRLYKLFFVDSGLMCAMMLNNIQAQVLTGDIFVNEGALAENYVACELFKHGVSLNYYDRKSKHELDFVFPENNKISIIEVKSGKR